MYTGPKLHNDNLAFGYDTGYGLDQGSSTRHYKGEPATNLITAGLPGYFGSGGETLYRNNYYGLNSDSGVFQRNFVNNPATASSQPNNNSGLYKNFTSAALSSSTEYILISFDFYMITPYVRYSNSSTGLNGYMGVLYTDGSTGNHGWNTSLNTPNAGDDWNNNSAYIGQWRKIALYVDLVDAKTPASISSMYIYNDKTITGEGIFTNFIITEHATLPTGPVLYTSGTRSDTQSLIDLKRTTSINVSNASFDSTGQLEFDGTDDEIQLASNDWNKVNTVTVEAVVLIKGTPIDGNSYHVVAQKDGAYSGGAVYGIRIGSNNIPYGTFSKGTSSSETHVDTVSGTAMTANKYYHLVYTRRVGESVFYQNGEGINSATGSNDAILNNTSTVTIGQGDGRQLYGNIPVLKIYDVVLSAAEIKQNYNAYKNRFNI